ncbi:histidine kinase dimerization/phospho-acceptor domain-containing protein [Rubrivirga sp. IMCC45206]|uniref:histidine kinase dimerization/phospho-acceptor domain-containing protein n=1 Tax=Rubrivirga sp. IMCC45206 TaxID=3391614 RepID=UPI003990313A
MRLIADRLGVPAALLFATGAGGALRAVAGVGGWRGDAAALHDLVEALAAGEGDLTDAIEGARFAAGARLGDGEGALVVLAPDPRTPDDAWNAAFGESAQAALALIRAAPGAAEPGRLLHEVSVYPGPFDARLALALERMAGSLGLDAAVLAWIEDGTWAPHAAFDPSGALVPRGPVPLADTFCAVTSQADGPYAVEDAAQSPLGVDGAACYLGAPVFVGGRCAGTLSAVAARPRRRAFSEAERSLVESLARWAGSAIEGRRTAVALEAREADLAAFFDAAPMGMGVARLLDGDVEFVRVNAAGAAALGSTPDALAGRLGSETALASRLGLEWLHACHQALADGPARRFDLAVEGDGPARTLRTTVSHIAADDDGTPRFAFVVEDATDPDALASASRDALLKEIDREIRSPLTSILGYADLLDEHSSPAELAEVRDVISRAGERLLVVLDDLALLSDGDLVGTPAPTDVVAIVDAAATASRPAAEARRVSLNLWCTLPDEPLLLDGALFERAVRILVGGAVSTAERVVDVRLHAEADRIELSVAGGAPGDAPGLHGGHLPRLAKALGGVAAPLDGGVGWTLRLPRRIVPVVDLGSDGHTGAAPELADLAEERDG